MKFHFEFCHIRFLDRSVTYFRFPLDVTGGFGKDLTVVDINGVTHVFPAESILEFTTLIGY